MKNGEALSIRKIGYGHWYVSMNYYNKQIACTTTNSMAIDDYSSDEFEKDGRELRKLRGLKQLRNEIIRNHEKTV